MPKKTSCTTPLQELCERERLLEQQNVFHVTSMQERIPLMAKFDVQRQLGSKYNAVSVCVRSIHHIGPSLH